MAEGLSDDRKAAEGLPHLRFLRGLVASLAIVMGLGILAIVALLWLRLGPGGAVPSLPPAIALPEGATAAAVTFARDWTVIVTDAGAVLVYDRAGTLRQTVVPQAGEGDPARDQP